MGVEAQGWQERQTPWDRQAPGAPLGLLMLEAGRDEPDAAPASPRIVSEMFREWRPETGSEVPFIQYQEYTLRRHRRQINTGHDVGRFTALMWYIEVYGPSRLPFRAPLAGRQIRWLLQTADACTEAQALPRIAEWFRRRTPDLPNPYLGDDAYSEVAFWWSVERSVAMGVEHALVPESFVSMLAAPDPGAVEAMPVNALLRIYAGRQPKVTWDFTTEAGRLAAYIRVLMEPNGVHLGLFFPTEVLARIKRQDDRASLPAGAGAPCAADMEAVKLRAGAAELYREKHRQLRSGAFDTCASLLGQDWMETGWEPPPSPRPVSRVFARPRTSAVSFPVRVIGPINSRSGLGQATRQSIRALENAGVAVDTIDFVLDNPAPRDDGLANMTPYAASFAVNLLHLNAESLPLAPAYMAVSTFENAYNIGYFFWELPQPAACHRLALRQVDEVWLSSEFNRQTYAAHTSSPVLDMGMTVGTTDRAEPPSKADVRIKYGLPPLATVFITTFDSFSYLARKNPAGTLRAFLTAFPTGRENVRLVIKTHNLLAKLGEVEADDLRREVLALCKRDQRIILINETVSHLDVMALKAACDVYVSLHRSEGWGFGMIEGMQLGLPSIATAFSGNLAFCNDETSWMTPWTQRFLTPDEYIFVTPGDYWAEPDLSAAAAFMRLAAADPDGRRRKGEAAKTFVEARFSPEAVGQVYLDRLRAIGCERGARPSPDYARAPAPAERL